MKIAVIEDSKKIGYIVYKAFERERIDVEIFESLEEARKIQPGHYQAYIVDFNLKDGEGIEFVKKVRARKEKTPILMLTVRDSLEDKLLGFDAGINDYMTKPFELAELVARIKNLINSESGPKSEAIEIDGIEFDFEKMKISYQGKKINFSKKEYQLIEYLIHNKGQIVDKDKIIDNLWIGSDDKAPNIVNVYINRIRSKLADAKAPNFITTVRGFGYVVK